jgi:phage replication-related protein YjqB (UPF0714/DUF867 family)
MGFLLFGPLATRTGLMSVHRPRFAELLARDGVEERLALRGRIGFMAFHGGNLERMTDEIAEVAAERSGASCYSVVQPFPMREHLPSIEVRPEHSPALEKFLSHITLAIALHGYGRNDMWTTVLLGGRNRSVANVLANRLRSEMPGFVFDDDLASIPTDLAGQHPLNPVNAPPHAGVQIELPPRIRGLTPHAKTMERVNGRIPWTNTFIDVLVEVATDLERVGLGPVQSSSGRSPARHSPDGSS